MRASFVPPLDPSAYPFQHEIRVRFAETDAMGIVHHAAYLPYLEEARVEWLRVLGHPYDVLRAEGTDFAVVEVQARYRAPARFDDIVQVHLGLGTRARSTFRIGYLLTVDDRPVLTAITAHAAVHSDRGVDHYLQVEAGRLLVAASDLGYHESRQMLPAQRLPDALLQAWRIDTNSIAGNREIIKG
mgnify:CR=1 FL=1